jgi:hypothetical protein
MASQSKTWEQLKVRGDKPATQVPTHIAELGKADCERWDHVMALTSLYDVGKIYSAAAKAVPLIADLLTSEPTPDKDTILVLLAATVAASPKPRMVWGLNLDRPDIKKFYARGTAKDVWEETWKHRETYVRLLDHSDAMVRSAAAFLLAFDFEGAAGVLSVVEGKASRESNPKTKASLLMSLGLLRSYAPSSKSELDLAAIAADDTQGTLVRGAAIMALLYAAQQPIDLNQAQRDVLVEWCDLSEVDVDGYPWNNGVTDMHCARVVEGHCVQGGVLAAEILAECIRRFGPKRRGNEWASGILELAFEPAAYALAAGPFMIDASVEQASAFTERQKALLKVLASYSFAAPFLSHGIPAEVRDRRRWLGLEPPGPMERVVEVDVLGQLRKWPVWLCLNVQQASDPNKGVDVNALLGTVSTPLQLLEIRLEYTHNAYSLRLGGSAYKEAMAHSQELLPWARDYLKYTARIFHDFGGTYSGGSLASATAMDIVIQEGRLEELLPEYDILIHPSWRNILEVIDVSRREDVVVSRLRSTFLEDAQAMWSAGVRGTVESSLENLDIYPTEAVANALFDLRDHIVSHGFTEFEDLCSAIEVECSKVSAEHGAFHAVVKRRFQRSS